MEKNTNVNKSKKTEFDISDDEIEEEEEEEVAVNKIIKKSPSTSTSTSPSNDVSNVHIPKETIERLLKDIKDIFMSSLEKEGIYYKHSDTNILKAYVMIVGQPDMERGTMDKLFNYKVYFIDAFICNG